MTGRVAGTARDASAVLDEPGGPATDPTAGTPPIGVAMAASASCPL
ncbi:hypothetical protein [Streptomyces sp. DSM 40907]|nr:hypothetical protein [Streptomyces sp. DSM 40907]